MARATRHMINFVVGTKPAHEAQCYIALAGSTAENEVEVWIREACSCCCGAEESLGSKKKNAMMLKEREK